MPPGRRPPPKYETKPLLGGVLGRITGASRIPVPTGRNSYTIPKGTPGLPSDPRYYTNLLGNSVEPPQTPGENTNLTGINQQNRSSSGRGRGGGGRAGPTPDQIRSLANELFVFNQDPYNQMRAATQGQRDQTNAYNPNFAGMEQDYLARGQQIDTSRAAAIKTQLDQLAGFGRDLATQQGQGLATGLRDLASQGFNSQPLQDQAAQQAGQRTGFLGAQGQYIGQLGASAANDAADYQRSMGLIRQGGEATLANNRGQLLNQLQQQDAQTALQQAQAQQSLEQAKRQFMIQNGIAG
jgi:hypothetical protein